MDILITEFERYLEEKKEASTVRAYRRVLNRFAEFLGTRAVANVSQQEVLTFLTERGKGEVRSKSRWNTELSVLRSLYKHLELKGVVNTKDNPTKDFEFDTPNKRTVTPLNYNQMFKLLDAIDAGNPLYRNRNKAIVLTLFHCGLRVAELISLNVQQLDDETHMLFHVPRKGGDVISTHLNAVVLPALQACRADRADLLAQTGTIERKGDEQPLFISATGERLSVRRVQSLIQVLGKRVGVQGLTPHIFRHTFASHLYELGVGLVEIKASLGHSSIKTTMGYIHSIPNNGSDKPLPSDLLGASWQKRQDAYRKQKQAEEPAVA